MQDVREKSPDYIEDLVDQGYLLAIEPSSQHYLENHSILKQMNIRQKYYESDDEFYADTKAYSSKIMHLMPRAVCSFNKQYNSEFLYLKFEDPVKFSKNNLLTSLNGIVYAGNDVFFGTFRDELKRLFESGIFQKLHRDSLPGLHSNNKHNKINAMRDYDRKSTQVLSWNHLYAGFYLWIGACLISALAFIGEVITNYLRNLFENYLKEIFFEHMMRLVVLK